ncbi:MAG TPA: methylenetetrahydrofolate--tRNA-(uracil(54)-C(5))-methyltransferase (FADH(2)-oxidizing) TrmFO [Patescibacteria group bacterium]|nr:methylenetetrahydrofolate--tRNA-(uracil(54)-C(5))-methyltransferase (FADH(2)-oxidizing) TrmFO [Patescibacteria group bacterium]
MSTSKIIIVGGGLAGSEAAWQAARRGLTVELHEMRPVRPTPVHQTSDLAELVCSNSLKSNLLDTASGLLKEEMRRLDSLIVQVADRVKVPAGGALAVDREAFARGVTDAIAAQPNIRLVRGEVTAIPDQGPCILATGPLASDAIAAAIGAFTGTEYLYFFDAISPIIEADTIDRSKVFGASRYGKGGDDYLNCPMTEPEYDRFYQALIGAAEVPSHDFEKRPPAGGVLRPCGIAGAGDAVGAGDVPYFEGCLPIEEMARRGRETLLFGPMKPVGLVDPRTGRQPFGVVQLRQDTLAADFYSMVGFQNHLKFGEQTRIFRMIPGLEQAEFPRLGQVHRNSYINAPAVLLPTFQARRRRDLFFAGQISGVEGYLESAASGLIAGINAARLADGGPAVIFPATTALGALARYISSSESANYQPTNIAFGLMPPLENDIRDKRRRKEAMVRRALGDLEAFAAAQLGTLVPAR